MRSRDWQGLPVLQGAWLARNEFEQMLPVLDEIAVQQLVEGECNDPFRLLGCHLDGDQGLVNAFLPGAEAVYLKTGAPGRPRKLKQHHPAGVFSTGILPAGKISGYRLLVQYPEGKFLKEDPYRFPSLLGEDDVWLFSEGRHETAWSFLGAHVCECDGVAGVQFVVWAPNARRVAVVGDFNFYDHRSHGMRFHPGCGIWDIFIPEVGAGAHYRFEVTTREDVLLQKADPYARQMLTPADSVAVVEADDFSWSDQDWQRDQHQMLSVYEVHAGSWRRSVDGDVLNYAEMAGELLDYVEDLGFSHIQFMPLAEHPFYGSWGYQPIGLFAPSCRYGSASDLKYLINEAHRRGIGVIIDWVPAHFPNDPHGLGRFDGTCLYEHEDPRLGQHPDWGTLIYNYSRSEVVNFLVGSALYWLDEFHVDGLRVDAVASMLYLDYSRDEGEWIPNRHGGNENLEAIEFIKRVNQAIQTHAPGALMIAEESTAWGGVSAPVEYGGLGFTHKWNMGWMHDTLKYFQHDPIHRKYHHNEITFSMVYAYSERFVLALSHDEVVHGKGSLLGKMPGDRWQQLANLRMLYAYMWAHPGRKHLFMGSEFGQEQEWNHDGQLQWDLLQQPAHNGLLSLVRDLNRLYQDEPALHEQDFDGAGFYWVDADNSEDSVLAFCRMPQQDHQHRVYVVINMTPVVREGYVLPVHEAGQYAELLNTDSAHYDGSNVGNASVLTSAQRGDGHVLELTLPPLAAVYIKQALS